MDREKTWPDQSANQDSPILDAVEPDSSGYVNLISGVCEFVLESPLQYHVESAKVRC